MAKKSAAQTRVRNIKFTTKRQIKRTNKAMAKARRQVAKEMTTALKRSISAPYPPASKPGNSPHLRTGTLRGKTEAVVRGREIVIKTTQVGIFLEGGTQNMEARPFINKEVSIKGKGRGISNKWAKRLNVLTRKFAK